MRADIADFEVEEIPNWTPDGSGEHDVLWVEKRRANTRWVAGQLARHAACRERDVSYAGLKDRHAVTRQWFSIYRPGRSIDWSAFEHPDIQILDASAHGRKIRVGALQGNRFRIRLTDVTVDGTQLERGLQSVRSYGVPNYFGPQRFGRHGSNLKLATRLADGERLRKSEQGFALSAARSLVFNAVLAARVNHDTWWRPLPGDALMLNNSHSFFVAGASDDTQTLERRAKLGDLHPTGPLIGAGESPVQDAARSLEEATMAGYASMLACVRQGRVDAQRRALRVLPSEFSAALDERVLTLAFSLPAGSFATALINELVAVTEAPA
ncbi:MAG: tRNA pseudouridine(13) synthase TruD [Pseudomonadota bacterium]